MLISLLVVLPFLAAGLFLACNFLTNALAAFLSVNKPIANAQVLVVEGWLFTPMLHYVKEEFERGQYANILVSGLPRDVVAGMSEPASDAARTGRALVAMGVDSSKIVIVQTNAGRVHKTFAMAQAARRWFATHDSSVKRINVCTVQGHGRKTWCAYRRVFAKTTQVGILSFPGRPLPVRAWWTTRRGIKWQLWFLAGYLDARFWPIWLLPHKESP